MKKVSVFLLLLLSFFSAKANDGVFYANGNQLIPIAESDISVKKEVLTINRVGNCLKVNVYYEFFNPVKAKDLLVGFEAEPPYPYDEEYLKLFPEQPHMRNFKVMVNGEALNYQVSHVAGGYYDYDGTKRDAPNYYLNGKVQGWSRQQCEDSIRANYYFNAPFMFVYHFNAHFREGLNVVQHSYDFDMSHSVEEEFDFVYILTAANRWANNGIDDFTLEVNMGDRESFMVNPTFFKSAKDWAINGKGKVTMETQWGLADEKGSPIFHIQEGSITYKKKNFHPEGELSINKRLDLIPYYIDGMYDGVDGNAIVEQMKELYHKLDKGFYDELDLSKFTSEHRRILRNMPFAYRGHVFKDAKLRQYFESTSWYLPDPDYKDNMEDLTPKEKEWVSFWFK
ncbi:MAG: YARHG domain-containing protein [Bacteroidales bacterium]|nr:YARHG domain-containing protein [Bacteroidales bacterium]